MRYFQSWPIKSLSVNFYSCSPSPINGEDSEDIGEGGAMSGKGLVSLNDCMEESPAPSHTLMGL